MTVSCEGKNIHVPEKGQILHRYIEARTKKSILVIEYEISQTTLKCAANNIKFRPKQLMFD